MADDIKYGTDKATGRRVMSVNGGPPQFVPEEAPAQAAPQEAPLPGNERKFVPAEDTGTWAQIKRSFGEGMDTAADMGTGAVSGATMGWDDELVGAMGGDAEARRARKALAARRSPVANAAGEIYGGVATTMATGGTGGVALKGGAGLAKAGGASLLKRAAASNVVQGAVQGAGDAAEGQKLEGGVKGGIVGGALGKLTKAAGGGASRLLSGETGRALTESADIARVRAAGLDPAQISGQPGGVARQAAAQREYGVGGGLIATKGGMRDKAGQGVRRVQAEREAISGNVPEDDFVTGDSIGNRMRMAADKLPIAESRVAKALRAKAAEYDPVVGPRQLAPAQVKVLEANRAAQAAAPPPSPVSPKATVPGGRARGAAPDPNRTVPGGRRTPPTPEAPTPDVDVPQPRELVDPSMRNRFADTTPDMPAMTKGPLARRFSGDAGVDVDRTVVDRGAPKRFADTKVARKPPVMTPEPAAPSAPPARAPAPPPVVKARKAVANQRLLNMRDLASERRGFSPSNWASESDEAMIGKYGHQAVSDAEAGLINRHAPGQGERFQKLGQDQAALIRAQEALMAGRGPGLPVGKYDAARKISGGLLPNAFATVTEGAAGLARRIGPRGGPNEAMLERGNEAATGLGLMVSRAAADGDEYVESSETPEEKALRDFQESYRNRDYGLSR